MQLKPIRTRPVVADAIARLVVDNAWSGTLPELHAALDGAALPEERRDPAWPSTLIVLAAGLRALSDDLRDRGLRMSRMPTELLIERLRPGVVQRPGSERQARAM